MASIRQLSAFACGVSLATSAFGVEQVTENFDTDPQTWWGQNNRPATSCLRQRRSRTLAFQIRRVYLPERGDRPLYLVCKSIPGKDRPLVLLTSLCAVDEEQTRRVLRYYRRRWRCEEAARFLKGRMGLERIALRTYEAFGPLLLLATLAMGLLTRILLGMPSLLIWLCRKTPGKHQIKFAYYRVLDWLQEQIGPLLPRSPPLRL